MTQGVVQALFGMMREAMGFQLTNFQDCFSSVLRFIFKCLMKTVRGELHGGRNGFGRAKSVFGS